MMALDELNLEKKFQNVSNSQDSIQSLSLWILHHKNQHKRIVQIWFKSFEKAKINHRLTLFYLANDVIQHAKKKGVHQYLDVFGEKLKEIMHMVNDEKIRGNIERVLNIWSDRNVYTDEFIENLKEILRGANLRPFDSFKVAPDFQISNLVEKIKKMTKLEAYTKSKVDAINTSKIDALTSEVLNQLKDKSHGEQFSKDFEDAAKLLDSAVHSMEKEIIVRTELIEYLEKSEGIFESQRKLAIGYKNYIIRIKNLKKKLSDSKPYLASPLPSPNTDAPSPTNSDDGPQLPGLDGSQSGINSMVFPFAENMKKPKFSSLDQRLSNLMQNKFAPISNDYGSPVQATNNNYSDSGSINLPPALQAALQLPLSNNWNNQNQIQQTQSPNQMYIQQHSFMPQHLPPPPPPPPPPITNRISSDELYMPHHLQAPYEYDYPNLANDQYSEMNNSNIQPIQAVISSRSEVTDQIDTGINLNQEPRLSHFNDYIPTQPRENFEPADMDLGNSDEEDTSNRAQNHPRVLKVIETRTPTQINDYHPYENKLDSWANNDRSYREHDPNHQNSMSPNLKSVARLATRPNAPIHNIQQNEPHRWGRSNNRSDMIDPHFQSPPSSQHPHHHQHRNWRPTTPNNRNNRRNNFNRRY